MKKTFLASLDNLHEMLQFVREQAQNAQFSENYVFKIELAIEEALVNIISYGYPKKPGYIEINCHIPEDAGLRIVIKDKGVPYNPIANLKKRTSKKSSTSGKRVNGGYGVYFILRIMDEVDYRRENDINILTLTKFKIIELF